MNREEKNQQTRRRILDSALAEFSVQGYGASSINTICGAQGISKGIIYHYFETKDDLYLACVEECFQLLTAYLKDNLPPHGEGIEAQLTSYFSARLAFFQAHPAYQRIFCDAVVMPPAHLRAAIQARKAPFDALNISILNRLIKPAVLRRDITQAEVVDVFRLYQDFINAKYQMVDARAIDIKAHEADCHLALSILLYGVLARKEA